MEFLTYLDNAIYKRDMSGTLKKDTSVGCILKCNSADFNSRYRLCCITPELLVSMPKHTLVAGYTL